MRYYFLFYGGDPHKLEKLIRAIEGTYKDIIYKEARDFTSWSISLWVLNFSPNNFKQIVFDNSGEEISPLCKECRFPLDVSWNLARDPKESLIICTNCGIPLLEQKRDGRHYYLNKNILGKIKT